MGCTGKGTPKTTPVKMLARPVKTRVEGRDMEPCRARAIIRGRRVPRSPRAPDNSEKGEDLRVLRLCLATRGMSRRPMLLTDARGELNQGGKTLFMNAMLYVNAQCYARCSALGTRRGKTRYLMRTRKRRQRRGGVGVDSGDASLDFDRGRRRVTCCGIHTSGPAPGRNLRFGNAFHELISSLFSTRSLKIEVSRRRFISSGAADQPGLQRRV